MSEFTHRQLCEIGSKWLKRSQSQNGHGCHIAIIEAACYGENPDVIGFRHGYDRNGAIVLEAKTSRSDFLADRKKPHRQVGFGMGRWRYYICPEGLIDCNELPEGWGLVYVNARGHIKIICGAMYNASKTGWELEQNFYAWQFHQHDYNMEMAVLAMALARFGDDVEEAIYAKRHSSRLEMALQKTQHKLLAAEQKIKRLENRAMFGTGSIA